VRVSSTFCLKVHQRLWPLIWKYRIEENLSIWKADLRQSVFSPLQKVRKVDEGNKFHIWSYWQSSSEGQAHTLQEVVVIFFSLSLSLSGLKILKFSLKSTRMKMQFLVHEGSQPFFICSFYCCFSWVILRIKRLFASCWCLTPIILGTQKAENRRITFQSQPRQKKSSRDPAWKNPS
jgi:hypothetical protein